jgi:hypothetical protein
MAARRSRPHADPRQWYQLERWRRLRRAHLRTQPLCIACLKRSRVMIATIVDHVQDHGGDWNKFLTEPLQSLCRDCHELKHGRLLARPVVIGVDGWPLAEPLVRGGRG